MIEIDDVFSKEIIREFCQTYSQCNENLFVKKLREHFSDSDINIIIGIILTICTECFNNESPCYCMRDD